MKKLIFRKFAKDTSIFFVIMCLTIGTIVWTLQAVNYFDFVTQDGHGLKTYFSFVILNFPKIIHRIIPFIFFISLFYILIDYETRNELVIYWTIGVSKIQFAHKIILLSLLLTIFQILIGGFFSPYSQFKARENLKTSNVDFFSSLIKEGKFINVVKGLTIFINKKNEDGSFSEVFLDDSSKAISKIIFAKNGVVVNDDNKKIFKLFDGKVLNKNKDKINEFKFDQIDFNLADYSTNTIVVPKLQEIPAHELARCFLQNFRNNKFNIDKINFFKCDESLIKELTQELFKRFYKPLYIPIIGLVTCFLVMVPKNSSSYKKNRRIIFLITFFILILSEASLRYATSSYLASTIYMMVPWIIFLSIYLFFFNRIKNV